MMSQRMSILVGVLLLIAGVLVLLLNFGLIGPLGDTLWTLLFIGGGVAFLVVYLSNRAQWWPIIPGMTLIGIGGIIFLSSGPLEGDWVPAVLFGAIALAFLIIYLTQPVENWWALIPGGVLASLGLPFLLPGGFHPGIFMLGMGVTFGLVYLQGLVRGLHHEFWWALIPAGVLALIGLFLIGGELPMLAQIFNLWPLALIVIGVVILLGALRNRHQIEEDEDVDSTAR